MVQSTVFSDKLNSVGSNADMSLLCSLDWLAVCIVKILNVKRVDFIHVRLSLHCVFQSLDGDVLQDN